jgi:hypothetical protein
MEIPEVAHSMCQQRDVALLSTESHCFLVQRQGPSILSGVAHDVRKCFERAYQLPSRAGLAFRLDHLEKASFRIFVTPFSSRLPCHVNRVFGGSHYFGPCPDAPT